MPPLMRQKRAVVLGEAEAEGYPHTPRQKRTLLSRLGPRTARQRAD